MCAPTPSPALRGDSCPAGKGDGASLLSARFSAAFVRARRGGAREPETDASWREANESSLWNQLSARMPASRSAPPSENKGRRCTAVLCGVHTIKRRMSINNTREYTCSALRSAAGAREEKSQACEGLITFFLPLRQARGRGGADTKNRILFSTHPMKSGNGSQQTNRCRHAVNLVSEPSQKMSLLHRPVFPISVHCHRKEGYARLLMSGAPMTFHPTV